MGASLLTLAAFALAHLSGTSVAAREKKTDEKAAILTKTGQLKADDEKDTKLTNSPRTVVPIKLTSGKVYQIDLKSKDFDSFLRLEDSTGKEVAFDDDGGGFPDARIEYKASKTEEFKIIVTSFDAKSGAFTLTVKEMAGGAAATTKTNSRFQGKAMEFALKDGKGTQIGELTEKDPVVQQHYFKIYTVQLEKGKTYRIDYKDAGDDPKFDPFLFLEDAEGNGIDQDDDSGGGLNSRLILKAPKTGTYRLIATTLPPNQTGKYTLEIGPADAAETKEADLKYRISNYGTLSGAQRKNIVQDLAKRFRDKAGDLTINDARLAFQFSMEVEEDLDVAREVLKDYIKTFGAANNPQLAGLSKQFEASLKNLDKLGKPMEITGKTTDGKDYDLAKMKGKVVLVDFWATWCGPCIAELPNMEKAYAKYHGRGFDIIGISLDRPGDEQKLVTFMENRKMPWPCINIEDSRKLADKYEVNAIPYPVLIDQAGNVVSLRARGPQLERLLERLLPEKK